MIKKFFLADDDSDDTDLFEEALRKIDSSIEFHFARNGKQLIQLLKSGKIKPQIIFLDINMPEMDGWESLQRLKAENDYQDIPVIMYSTSSVMLEGKKAVDSGALCYYEKPTNFLVLKEFLEQISSSSIPGLKESIKLIRSSKKHKIYTE